MVKPDSPIAARLATRCTCITNKQRTNNEQDNKRRRMLEYHGVILCDPTPSTESNYRSAVVGTQLTVARDTHAYALESTVHQSRYRHSLSLVLRSA